MIPSIYLEITVLLTGVILLLFEAFTSQQSKNGVAWGGIAGLTLALVLSFFVSSEIPSGAPYAHFYVADQMAIFFKRFALVTAILVLVMSMEYKGVLRSFIFGSKGEAGVGEFYCLPVFTCAGLMWMASAVDFIMIFVSLELVTISFYVLVSYMRRNHGSLEAGVKYLILGALSTGFLVYGITWIFGVTGQTNLAQITEHSKGLANVSTPLLFGVALVLIALGFKIAAVPFQLWVPDVYQGAPTPITAYLSVGSKAAGFVVLMRVLTAFLHVEFLQAKLGAVLVILAGLTLVYGNLAAIPQDNLKRLLGYSSIAHAGYLLVGVASLNPAGEIPTSAVIFYLAGYLAMTLLAFLVMIAVANHSGGDDISHFRGLSKRSPLLAFGMLVAMSSLAGIPLTAGFLGKFLVFFAAVDQHHYVLAVIGIVTVAAGFYYYLKVVRSMYWMEPDITTPVTASGLTKFAVVVLVVLTFVLGVYPQPVFKMLSPDAAAQSANAGGLALLGK